MSVEYSRRGRIALIHARILDSTAAEIRRSLDEAFKRLGADDEAWIAVVSSDGANFYGGLSGRVDDEDISEKARRERYKTWAGGHHEIWKPIIAAVQGRCSGESAGLALACDFRVGSAETTFEFDMAVLGDHPNVNAAWLLTLVGLSKSQELLWLGESLSASQALSLGLLNRVVERGMLEEAEEEGRLPMKPLDRSLTTLNGDVHEGAIRFAEQLLLNAPLTRKFQKEIAYRSVGVPFQYAQSLEIGVNPLGSADRIEGNKAFVENRRPVWRNS